MNKEREKLILEQLLIKNEVTVKVLAEKLYASEPSIRRDLLSLEKQGFLKRVHGGAILEDNPVSKMKIPFLIRELEDTDEKMIIARKAAALVKDNCSIMLDNSSSSYYLLPFLSQRNNLTIITNSIKSLSKASEYNINTISTGGRYLNSGHSLVGEDAHNTIHSYNADICFFSCRGISTDGYITDISIEENIVRQHMMKQSKTNVLLVASKKFGKKYLHNLCKSEDVDFIISDKPLPEELAEKEFITDYFLLPKKS